MSYETKRWSRTVGVFVLVAVALTMAAPAEAQRDYEPLFDKFNFRLEGSWVGLKTEIRLDSKTLGEGTTLSFEDDLNLGSNTAIPSLAFEWQIARKHRLGVRWQDISRDSSAQALTEIQWGDETIPIDANITLAFDTTQAYIDYTYFPWVKDRWAAGFGLGFRVMDISATLAWEEEIIGGGEGTAKGTAPLPYLYFEYRRLFSDHWRFVTGLGWLYLKIEDIEGGQWIGRASIEYLLGKRWAFGASVNLATIGVDWEGDEFLGRFESNVNDVSVFARVRF
ncbi:MAG: hypothetical protein IFK93_13015 [Acidobacteria bacterium]|nr:hypothetical protein [Candidatus Sulfomarinibacter kjeldsenii]MBD3855595.1 hypothetical protein [Candidatus Sulfomarinibacter kjeldsenii]